MDYKDKYNRAFKTLRVSLINKCNMSCVYCVAPNATFELVSKTPDVQTLLNLEDYILYIKKIHQTVGLKEIKLTGGEPLLFKPIEQLIAAIYQMGIPEVSLTTNGILLLQKLDALKKSGLKKINISLDAIDPETFYSITKYKSIRTIIDGIEAAIHQGFEVKINMVVLNTINEHQIIPMLEFAQSRNIKVRFLELMRMGYLHYTSDTYFFSLENILNKIKQFTTVRELPRMSNATATYWSGANGWHFGIIPNESKPFCEDCDRLRMDQYGKLYGCLSTINSYTMHPHFTKYEMQQVLMDAMKDKKDAFEGSELSMKYIGG
jgi:cyclic pyranopterin phosphate synthase